MNDPEYKKQIGLLRSHRVKGGDLVGDKLIKLKTEKLPLFDAINKIIKEAQLIAETKLIESREDIQNTILMQQQADKQMSLGDVQGASDTQKKELETRKLLQMAK